MWSLVGTSDELVFLCDSMCLCVLCGKGFLDIRYQILDISWRVNFIIHASFAFFKLMHLIKGRLIGLTLRLNFPSTSTT